MDSVFNPMYPLFVVEDFSAIDLGGNTNP